LKIDRLRRLASRLSTIRANVTERPRAPRGRCHRHASAPDRAHRPRAL